MGWHVYLQMWGVIWGDYMWAGCAQLCAAFYYCFAVVSNRTSEHAQEESHQVTTRQWGGVTQTKNQEISGRYDWFCLGIGCRRRSEAEPQMAAALVLSRWSLVTEGWRWVRSYLALRKGATCNWTKALSRTISKSIVQMDLRWTCGWQQWCTCSEDRQVKTIK